MTRRVLSSFAVAVVVGCEDDEPLDTSLDPNANVVSESPTPFAPVQGGMGQGTYADTLPLTFFVLTEGTLRNAGETNCGQFVAGDGNLDVHLYGVLAPGTWTVGSTEPQAGTARIEFDGSFWSAGTVTIDQGAEERGSVVRGSLNASTEAEDHLSMTFQFLFHGCGRD